MDIDMDVNQLIKKVEPYEYISFDLFDTLIFRTFHAPLDVLDAVEYQYNATHISPISKFRKLRYDAELQARKMFPNREITMEDIYENIEHSDKEWLKTCEKEIEIANCISNAVMIDFLHLLQQKRKKIIITTDMYLDRDTIEKILQKIGVFEDALFLSSEIGVTKVSGKLFPYLLKEMQIKPSQIVHLGDNPVSDIQKPREAGIMAIERLLPDQFFEKTYHKDRGYGIVENHIRTFNKLTMPDNSPECMVGYSVLGPLVMEFCKWLYEQQNINQSTKVLFVAREGFLLRNAYLRMYPNEKPRVDYIMLNKNLLRQPILHIDPTPRRLLASLPAKNEYIVKDILSALYVNQNFIDNFSCKYTVDTVLQRKQILNGSHDVFFEELFDKLRNNFKYQFECLLRYLIDLEVLKGKILLVNNSINGNGQKMLEDILKMSGLTAEIKGIQFVQSRKCCEVLGDRSISWISKSQLPRYYTMQFNHYALLLEHLLFESSGTAKCFWMDEENFVNVECETQGKEEDNNQSVQKIQEYALEYIKEYSEVFPLYMGNYIINFFVDLYREPEFRVASMLGELWDCDYSGDKRIIDAMDWTQARIVIEGKNKRALFIYNLKEIIDCKKKAGLSQLKEYVINRSLDYIKKFKK